MHGQHTSMLYISFSKILEKLMYNMLVSSINKHLPEAQIGFRKMKCTKSTNLQNQLHNYRTNNADVMNMKPKAYYPSVLPAV